MLCSFRVPAFYFPWSRSSQIVSYFLNKTNVLFLSSWNIFVCWHSLYWQQSNCPSPPSVSGRCGILFRLILCWPEEIAGFSSLPSLCLHVSLNQRPVTQNVDRIVHFVQKQTKQKKKTNRVEEYRSFFSSLSFESINGIVETRFANTSNATAFVSSSMCLERVTACAIASDGRVVWPILDDEL